jgi:ABC-type sulfate/molybdate transport systems ATPase subunit
MQLELLHVQRAVGITFIYVTHDQEEALSMSDRIAVLNNGRIEQVGSPLEVYERPRTGFVAGFIGVSNLIERDGRRITVRPEKIRLLSADEPAPDGAAIESGQIRDVVYAGVLTRYIVDLDAAGAQNTLPLWIFGAIRLGQQLPEVNAVVSIVIAATIIPVVLAARVAGAGSLARSTRAEPVEGPGH